MDGRINNGKPRLDKSLCYKCQWTPVQIRTTPIGNWFKNDLGMCMECYEREVRRTRLSDYNRSIESLDLGADRVLVFF